MYQQTLVWHECLLRFSRSYAAGLSGENQVKLYHAAKVHPHAGGITDEILRVLRAAGESSCGGTKSAGFGATDIVI